MIQLTFDDVINKLEQLANSHIDITSHYRWNMSEFDGDVRPDNSLTLMTYEAPQLTPTNTESNLLLNYRCAFNILGKTGVDTTDVTDEAPQNEVLNHTLNIALEVYRKLIEHCETPFIDDSPNQWYSRLEKLETSFTKVGPVTTSYLYGYRCEFTINPKFITTPDANKWQ